MTKHMDMYHAACIATKELENVWENVGDYDADVWQEMVYCEMRKNVWGSVQYMNLDTDLWMDVRACIWAKDINFERLVELHNRMVTVQAGVDSAAGGHALMCMAALHMKQYVPAWGYYECLVRNVGGSDEWETKALERMRRFLLRAAEMCSFARD